jgi:hypothetical protein
MRLVAPPDALTFVRANGGRLFVWTESTRCCSGLTTRLKASTEPDPGREFRSVPSDQLDVFFPERLARLPQELHLELKGRRRRRLEAYWDGCAWVN